MRKKSVSLRELMWGVTNEQPNLTITVPSASVMLTIQDDPNSIGRVVIYYECDPETPEVEVEFKAISEGEIGAGFFYAGCTWYNGLLVAVYARPEYVRSLAGESE